MLRIKKLFIDFDSTLVLTIKRICDLYNEDFKNHPEFKYINWVDVNTWEFKELNCASRDYINEYFKQPRFFENLEFMDNAEEIIFELIKKGYWISIVTMGSLKNLKLKKEWLDKKGLLEHIKFIGCDFSKYKDKSHVDMSGGLFIDDEDRYLMTSNADIKICFGDIYPWNENCEYTRSYNWCDVRRDLKYI